MLVVGSGEGNPIAPMVADPALAPSSGSLPQIPVLMLAQAACDKLQPALPAQVALAATVPPIWDAGSELLVLLACLAACVGAYWASLQLAPANPDPDHDPDDPGRGTRLTDPLCSVVDTARTHAHRASKSSNSVPRTTRKESLPPASSTRAPCPASVGLREHVPLLPSALSLLSPSLTLSEPLAWLGGLLALAALLALYFGGRVAGSLVAVLYAALAGAALAELLAEAWALLCAWLFASLLPRR
jgi:hypothetical protein